MTKSAAAAAAAAIDVVLATAAVAATFADVNQALGVQSRRRPTVGSSVPSTFLAKQAPYAPGALQYTVK